MLIINKRLYFLETAQVGITYSLDNPVLVAKSGAERRNISKSQPLAEYSIAPLVVSKKQLDDLLETYRLCEGKRNSFLFKDPIDHQITKDKFDTGLGVYTQGRILDCGSYKYLIKAYAVRTTPGKVLVRPRNIAFPDSETLSTKGLVTEYGTGKLLSASASLPDFCEFYTPVTFADEAINYSLLPRGDCRGYAQLQGLKLKEVLDNCSDALPWAELNTPYFAP